METSVTFIGASANEIICRNNSGFFLTKGQSEVMLEYRIIFKYLTKRQLNMFFFKISIFILIKKHSYLILAFRK